MRKAKKTKAAALLLGWFLLLGQLAGCGGGSAGTSGGGTERGG
ncbi:hypothetical protein HMSSN036_34610 [Paenibacillus macerans]|nr:hypothetical protein HMSSN036_34610 [Paenibacillus macerans]